MEISGFSSEKVAGPTAEGRSSHYANRNWRQMTAVAQKKECSSALSVTRLLSQA